MKILLFTDFCPTVDNYRGPSSLCLYLMKELAKRNEVKIITTNANKVPDKMIKEAEKELGLTMCITPRNLMYKLLVSRKTGALFTPFLGNKYGYLSRYDLTRSQLKKIENFNPDIVVIYPYHLIRVVKQLKKYKTCVIGPDCSVLGRLRMLADGYVYQNHTEKSVIKEITKCLNIERSLAKNADMIALVGRRDTEVFNQCTMSSKARFMPHPHYSYEENAPDFSSSILRVVITGGYDSACKTDIDKMIAALQNAPDCLQNYHFTFIGKTWREVVEKLKDIMSVEYKTWVDDYNAELITHDIQLVPISYGVGTKGKVLQAMTNGLLCIGSYYAMENVAGRSGEEFMMYSDISELPDILNSIIANKDLYEELAEKGRKKSLEYHTAAIGAKMIESLITGKAPKIEECY